MSTTPEDPQQPGGQVPPPQGYQAPPSAAGYGAPAAQPQLSDSDQRTWAMLSHLSGFLSIIATIAIWAIYKDRGSYVKDQVTEALNFQITAAIATIAGFVVISIISLVTAGIGTILWVAYLVFPVFMILAAVATNKGEPYRYPFNLRLVK
jgi:uncharacterized protein